MEHQLMTVLQKRENDRQFLIIVDNVRRMNTGLADLLMMNRSMVDRHIEALEQSRLSLVKEG